MDFFYLKPDDDYDFSHSQTVGKSCEALWSGENRQLVTDEPVEFEN